MKPCSCALLTLLLTLQTLAQQHPGNLSRLKKEIISLSPDANTTNAVATASFFRQFEVLDLRTDTSRIGIHYFVPDLGAPNDKQLVFNKPTAAALSAYLNACLANPNASHTALIVIRRLWLSDVIPLQMAVSKDPEKLKEKTLTLLKAEIYAVKDGDYMPVFRFDSLLVYKEEKPALSTSLYLTWGNGLSGLLDQMIDSASRLADQKEGHAHLIHWEDIRDFNQSHSVNPLGSSQPLTAGVYASFEEFRHNSPSIQNFEVKKEKEKMLLYLKEPGGNTYYTRGPWGYCDGKNIYVMQNGCLCPAWQEGNTLYFYGTAYKQVTVQPSYVAVVGNISPEAGLGIDAATVLASSSVNHKNIRPRLCAVDMDSGKCY